jgi:hypothetical protein
VKVLYLDIDGVLFIYGTYNFSKIACNNLKKLLEEVPDLKIVISSSWRHLGMDTVKKTLDFHGIDKNRIIDCTGSERGTRGGQVQAWMDRNPGVTNFVVIDDERDFPTMLDHLVRPNGYVGLTSADVKKCLDILKLPV